MNINIYALSKTLLLFGLSTSLFAAEEKIDCEDFFQPTTQVLSNDVDRSNHLAQLDLAAFKGDADNLEALLDELPQLSKQPFSKDHNNAHLKRATIYKKLIDQWFLGAKVRMNLPKDCQKACWQEASEIALQMLVEQKPTFDPTQYPCIQALPVKTTEKKRSSFIHTSIQEYLAAYAIYQHITQLQDKNEPLATTHPWNNCYIHKKPAIVEFLCDMISDHPQAQEAFTATIRQARIKDQSLLQTLQKNYQHDLSIEELVSTYTNMIQEYGNKEALFAWQSRIAAGNSATVLVAAHAFVHEKEDLRGLCLQGAVLDGAKMKNIDCTDALWIDSSFRSVNASGSNFEKAIMHKLDFGTSIKEKIKDETIVNVSDLGHGQIMIETNKALYTWDRKKKSLKKGYVPFLNAEGQEIAALQNITFIEKPLVAINAQTKEYLWETPLSAKNMQYVEFSQNGKFLLAKSTLPDLDELGKEQEGDLYIIDLESGKYHLFKNICEYKEDKKCKASNLLFTMSWDTLCIIDMKSGRCHAFKEVMDYQISENGNFLLLKHYGYFHRKDPWRIIHLGTEKTIRSFSKLDQISGIVDGCIDEVKAFKNVSKNFGKGTNEKCKESTKGKRFMITHNSDNLSPDVLCTHPKTNISIQQLKKSHFIGKIVSNLSKTIIADNVTQLSYRYPNIHYITHGMTKNTTYQVLSLTSSTLRPSTVLKGVTHIELNEKNDLVGYIRQVADTCIYKIYSLPYPLPNRDTVCKVSPKGGKYLCINDTYKGTLALYDIVFSSPDQQPIPIKTFSDIVSFDLNSKYIAYTKRDKSFWIMPTGEKEAKHVTNNIDRCLFAPDGKHAFLIYNQHTVHIWDISASPPVQTGAITPHDTPITAMNCIDNGHILVTASKDGTVKQWILQENHQKNSFLYRHRRDPLTDNIHYNYIEFSPIAPFLCVKDCANDEEEGGQGRIMDKKGHLHTFKKAYAFEVSPQGDVLVKENKYFGNLHIMDTKHVVHTFKNVSGYGFSPQGDLLFVKDTTSSHIGDLRIIDMQPKKVIHTFKNLGQWNVSKTGDLLFLKDCSKYTPGVLRVVDVKSGEVIQTIEEVGYFEEVETNTLLLVKDCEVHRKGQLRIIDIKTGNELYTFDEIEHHEKSEKAPYLFIKNCEEEKQGQLHIIHTKKRQTFTIDEVSDYKACCKTARLFARDKAGKLRIIDMGSGQLLHTFQDVAQFKVDPSGTFLLVKDVKIYKQGIIDIIANLRIIDIKTGKVKKTLKDIGAFEISRSGRFFFLKNCRLLTRGTLTIIDTQTSRSCSFDNIGKFRETPSGGFLVTSDHRDHLSLIDAQRKRVVKTLDNIQYFRISPLGDFLIAKDQPLDAQDRQQVGHLHIIDIKKSKFYTFDHVGAFTLSPSRDLLFAKDAKSNEEGCLHIIVLSTQRILATLPNIVGYINFSYPSQPTLLSVMHANGKVSLWEVSQNKVIQQWKTGMPELTLQTANFTEVQGLSSNTIDMLSKYGATITNELSEEKELLLLDQLPMYLHNEGFSGTYIEQFLDWLYREDFDGEALCLDIAATRQSNIRRFDPAIYNSIANFIPHQYAYTSTSTSQKALKTQPEKDMMKPYMLLLLESNYKSLDFFKKYYGGPHPDTAGAYKDIADLYEKAGFYDKAIFNYKNAMDTYTALYGGPSSNGDECYDKIIEIQVKKDKAKAVLLEKEKTQ
ncbi:MAG: hypothetical protein AAF335_02125 [Bacteroidota bacterium]